MKSFFLCALLVSTAGLFPLLGDRLIAQNSTRGCGSPIVLNSRINQLQLNCNQNNLDLVRVVNRLNDLANRNVLTTNDLQSIATVLNAKIDKISNDTDEILLLLREVMSRLDIASANPAKAPTILRPYLDAAVDISNRAYDVNEFLDVNGTSEFRLVFQLRGNCQVFLTRPRGTGFSVSLRLLSDRGSPIWSSLPGTQTDSRYRPLPLSAGVYQFVMKARRGAGQYAATVASRCS